MKKLIAAIGIPALFVLLAHPLHAQEGFVTLDQVNVNGDKVEMSLSGPAKYHAFKISNPPRIVVEFSNTEFNAKGKEIAVNGPLVRRVRGGQFQNDPIKLAHVVVDLSRSIDYQLTGSGKQVTLTLVPPAGMAKAAAEAAAPDLKAIEKNARDLKAHRRSAATASPAVKTLNVVPVPAPITPPAPAPVPAPKAVKTPASPATAVAPVPAPAPKTVKTVESSPTVLQPAPPAIAPAPSKETAVNPVPAKKESVNPEFSDDEVVAQEIGKETPKVKVTLPPQEKPAAPKSEPAASPAAAAPAAAAPAAAPAAPAPKTAARPAPVDPGKVVLPKKPIMIDAEEMDIRDVLRVLSMKSGINIIYGNDVSGTITLHLDNVPFDKAFETILSLKGLVSQEMGSNILRVATPEKIAQERAQAVTFTKVFPLNYAKAEEVKVNLDSIRNAEGRRGNISVDERTNSLIVTDTPEGLTSIERIIAELDRKPEQVIIEARIVEVTLNKGLDLGIEWQYASNLANEPGRTITVGATRSAVSSSGGGVNATANATVVTPLSPLDGGTGVSLPAAPVGGQIGAISFGIITNQTRLAGMLTALATKGLSKILSTPKVTTINNKEAKILVGQKIPFTTTTLTNSGSTQSTNFMDVGIKLTVTPTINVDQKITLQVHPEVSLFVRNDPAGPVIGTREALTTVLVNNNETVVIGGLITEDDKKLGTQVPLLGDLPVIGHLFKRTTDTKERTELLVFLTPQIVN